MFLFEQRAIIQGHLQIFCSGVRRNKRSGYAWRQRGYIACVAVAGVVAVQAVHARRRAKARLQG